jgi:hypothetical protein
MTQALPLPTKPPIEALAASAVVWLVRLLGVLVAPGAERRRRGLRRFLDHIERAVECIIFLWAVERLGPRPRKRRRPRSVPPGFRRAMGSRRLFWKSARIRARGADALARVSRLLEVLARPAPYIARFLRRLLRGVAFSRLVPCAPPAHACASLARPDAAFADSS